MSLSLRISKTESLFLHTPRRFNRLVLLGEVVLGSPQKNCAGSGICQLIAPVSGRGKAAGQTCRRVVAMIRIESGGQQVFLFLKKDLCSRIRQRFFANGVFAVESPFEHEQMYGRDHLYIFITPGHYPVRESEAFYTVDFGQPRKDLI